MIFDILTIFPGMFEAPLGESILGKAQARGIIQVRVHNIRDYATDKHQMTDDRPFGGGEGMVMKPEPIVSALEGLCREGPRPWVILLSPQGRLFNQKIAWELSRRPRVMLICGRYEGVDERVSEYYTDEQISIGDYVLTGGELAAMVVTDSVTRLIPGVLGNAGSALVESFSEPILEYPQYTRPQEFNGYRVPEILLSGHHEVIHRWRRGQALLRTKLRRPDLFLRLDLSEEDRELLRLAEEEFEEVSRKTETTDVQEKGSTLCGSGSLSGFES
ncbi:tRNA (guanosine(37)-N1)-methyltransferase TrmD [Desulforhabdus amnigena]|jgi:tRNA (guanine37-N1)-methyltransferase|uniref:tRNA (guanine-N(1)-)-methyltransferase n=1 Tax=Desulforhabdus amnigena TaxID=40218 RepID=A0A9W6FVT4_9BACT|nr:tRNA (guanosine(37)-N1)-methyltransferase TrmD [Desulforhabdus amnigena]NLJ27005.1 tRNA (guanosine(37)-N1)-methyltransferase TrmD [Deltaproteobacteria bacterium]GLI35816.1 tRNA (guanine-N(1)-)-methyltransferase [Desulforhabdus amnigena]